MTEYASCYFCGTAVDAPIAETPLVPDEVDPHIDTGATVGLCPTCRRKLDHVLEPVIAELARLHEDSVADVSTSGSPVAEDGPGEGIHSTPDAGSTPTPDGSRSDGTTDDSGSVPTPAESTESVESDGSTDPSTADTADGTTDGPTGATDGEHSPGTEEETGETPSDSEQEDQPADERDGQFFSHDDTETARMDQPDRNESRESEAVETETDPDPETAPATDKRRDSDGTKPGPSGDDAATSTGTDSRTRSGDKDGPPTPRASGDPSSGQGSDSERDGASATGSGDPRTTQGNGTANSAGDDNSTDHGDGDDSSIDTDDIPVEAYNRIVRLLKNREFPVERAEIEEVAASAYDLPRRDCETALDAMVARGVLTEDDGRLTPGEDAQ